MAQCVASRTRRIIAYILLFKVAWIIVPVQGSDLEQPPSASGIEFFESHVRPLLVEHCYECHGAEEQSGGLRLDSRSGWLQGGDSGITLIAGQPDASLLIEAVGYLDQDLQMPPRGKLAESQLDILRRWIAMGAPDPREVQVDANPSDAPVLGMNLEDGRDFWSFQPLAKSTVPLVQDREWVRTPVDAFILAQLEAIQLRPAFPAEKHDLLRRVTLDLIGLPPTPQEMKAFLANPSAIAFEQIVDRLLASPQYGERWGRHWLDVVRYADSNGLDENLAFGNAWRYRDYVIQAFNSDKRFDRFLIEQLAGDLLPEANLQTLTATGFLVLGAKILAEPDREKLVMDTIDEQMDTTGKAFLGMTFGCVRCHDHKFDPVYQTDYYALAAIFKSTTAFAGTNTGAIKHWHETSFSSDQELLQLQEVNIAIAKKNSIAATYKAQAMAKLRSEVTRQTARYWAAASRFGPHTPLKDIEAIARPLGLHPHVLHDCRLRLEIEREDALLTLWHQMVRRGAEPDEIEQYFQALFDQVIAEEELLTSLVGTEEGATGRLEAQSHPLSARVKAVLDDKTGFLRVPPQPEFAFDKETLHEYYRLEDEARLFESNAPDEAAVMSARDSNVLISLPVHIRGSHRNLGEPVEREFPQVMRASAVRPVFPRNQSGRLELAQWMASSQHPLTARVYVNRLWRWHFGRGLVATTENFGALGAQPTHRELLDWLARDFIESGWSTKHLHRRLVLSNAYQMASVHPGQQVAQTLDPANSLLWRFPRQRLEAEQLRDSLLMVSGLLDESMGGKTVPLRNRQFVFNHTSRDHTKYDSLRRAVYLPVIRNNLYAFFELFDFPDPTMPTGDRQATIVAPQALLMMNDELVMDCAEALVGRVSDGSHPTETRIQIAYEWALGRQPSQLETVRAMDFIANLEGQLEAGTDESEVNHAVRQAWMLFCQSLLASNEFIYIK